MNKELTGYWSIINLIAYISMIIVNILANTLPIGGRTTGEVSALFPVLLTPASYAFSIWILIYLLLAIFVLIQLVPAWQNQKLLQTIGPWFIISCIFNIIWIFQWHHLYMKSATYILIALLITLYVIYLRIYRLADENGFQEGKFFSYLRPFSIYLAWVFVATLIQINIALSIIWRNNWEQIEVPIAIISIIIAAIITLLFSNYYNDLLFLFVVVWALLAIGINQLDQPLISSLSFGLSILLILAAVWIFRREVRKR